MYSSAAKPAAEAACADHRAQGPKLIVFSGLMGSGKSTSARELKQQLKSAWLIARDQFRDSVLGGADVLGNQEATITQAMLVLAKLALSLGHDVIIDDLNLFPEDKERWFTLARRMGIDIEWRTMTTPVEECIRRDSLRPAPVGRGVIEAYARAADLLPEEASEEYSTRPEDEYASG